MAKNPLPAPFHDPLANVISSVLDTDRNPRRDFFHDRIRKLSSLLDQANMINRSDLKRIGP